MSDYREDMAVAHARDSGLKRKPMKRTQIKRDWSDARAKVDRQGCRVCGESWDAQAAHVIGRENDRPKTEGSKTLYVHPDSIVPLCKLHHRQYDEPSPSQEPLDLLPYMTLDEQLRAVEDAGGIELARVRTCPSQYRQEVA